MPRKALVDPVGVPHVNKRVTNLDIGKDQRLDASVLLIDGIEASCRIASKNAILLKHDFSAVSLLRVGLNDFYRIEALHIGQCLLAEGSNCALAENSVLPCPLDRGCQVWPDRDVYVGRHSIGWRVGARLTCGGRR